MQRERVSLGLPPKPASVEIGYYATSLSHRQYPDQELLKIIRDHWAAIENGSHYRRDNTFGEDACQTSKRGSRPSPGRLAQPGHWPLRTGKGTGPHPSQRIQILVPPDDGSTALKLLRRRLN